MAVQLRPEEGRRALEDLIRPPQLRVLRSSKWRTAFCLDCRRIAERRGANKARVAIARKVLTLIFYGLRDGEIRCLASAKAA